MKTSWNNSPRTAKMIVMGILSIGLVSLLWLWTAFPHAVVEAAGGEIIYVKADADESGDGTSWEDAFTDLQDALAEAKEGDQIWVAAGTYVPTGNGSGRQKHFTLKDDVEIYGGFAGNEDPAVFDLNDRNFTANETVLSGYIDNGTSRAYHVFFNDGVDETAVLDGVTILGGSAGGDGADFYGGGMYNKNSSPTLRNIFITDNYANRGPAMYNIDSSPVLINVKIQGNTTFYGYGDGGGLYNLRSHPQLTNVLISGNESSVGGAMYNNESNPILTNVTISGNYSRDGVNGGIYNVKSFPILRNSIVWTNTGKNISDVGDSKTTIEHSLVHHGNEDQYGSPDTESIFVNRALSWKSPTTEGDYRLKMGSVAIGKGNNSYFGAGSTPDLTHITTDLDGNPRIVSGAIDLGAYELSVKYVDRDAAGSGDGTSWGDAYPDLHHAIEEAGPGDQIWIAAGTYVPTGNGSGRAVHFRMKNGVEIYGGFAGDEDPAVFDLNDRDFTANETILSGDVNKDGKFDGNTYHVFLNNNLNKTAVLDGVTIRDGNANNDDISNPISNGHGGGMLNIRSSPTLRNVIVRDNESVNRGGGIYNLDGSNPVMTNMKIQGNYSWFGGGLFNDYSYPILTNVLISGNVAEYGGGMFNQHSSSVLTNVTISGNTGDIGGGIYQFDGHLTLRNSIIWTNIGESIRLVNGDTPTIENSLVHHRNDDEYGNPDTESIFVNRATEVRTTAGDYRLKKGSAAIGSGNNSYYDAGSTPDLSPIYTDLAGNPRFHGVIDLGAYESVWYAVSVLALSAEGGSVEGAGTYTYGEEVIVAAEANVGYTFVNWTEGSNVVSTAAEYSFEVTEDIALVAHFVDQTAPGIELDYSPTTWTKGEVTIIVDATDEGSGVEVVKWAAGNIDKAYFANNGNVVSTGSFNVASNGTYTVYARDVAGNVTVKSIHISNINTTVPLLKLKPSYAGPTNGEVTISVTASVYGSDSGNELVKLNWLAGSHSAVDFAGGASGKDLLSTPQFAVSSNGTYTVYALDSSGKEAVETIAISNIHTASPDLTLAHAPVGPTSGKVTISVTAAVYGSDSGNALDKLTWLAGSHVAADFAGGTSGEDILSTGQFAVSVNGTYTVYALDMAGNEAVAEIVISTIRAPASSGGGYVPVLPDNDESPVTEPSEDG